MYKSKQTSARIGSKGQREIERRARQRARKGYIYNTSAGVVRSAQSLSHSLSLSLLQGRVCMGDKQARLAAARLGDIFASVRARVHMHF